MPQWNCEQAYAQTVHFFVQDSNRHKLKRRALVDQRRSETATAIQLSHREARLVFDRFRATNQLLR